MHKVLFKEKHPHEKEKSIAPFVFRSTCLSERVEELSMSLAEGFLMLPPWTAVINNELEGVLGKVVKENCCVRE